MNRRSLAIPATLAVAALGGTAGVAATQGTNEAVAQDSEPSLSDVLAQLRRNAKVSERLNAGFFRAPQTRAFVGSAFRPTDDDVGFTADRGDSGLSLDAPSGPGVGQGQTTGTFELPLDIPNRAEVTEVEASYRDAPGGGGLSFSVVRLGRLGDQGEELLALPQGADPARGFPTTDNTTQTNHRLPLKNNAFRVDNSRNRYVLRVRIDDTNADTRFYGFTIQYVIGKGVPGAPTTG